MMPVRTAILRVMLWALGIAALTGAASVFVQSGDLMGRILGTEICAAIACALLLPCIGMVDRKRSRAAGLLGMSGVVFEFVLVVVTIWELARVFTGTRWEEQLVLSMFIVGPAVMVSMPLLVLLHRQTRAATAWIGLIVVGIASVAFLLATWLPDRLRLAAYWAETGGAVLATGAIMSLCLLGVGGEPRRAWRWVGVLFGGAAALLWFYDIWIGSGSDPGFVVFTSLLTGSTCVAYVIVCCHCPLKESQSWFRGAAIIAGLVTAALIELLVVDDRGFDLAVDTYWLERCAAASGIVTACGILSLAVLARMNRRVEFDPDRLDMADISIICPRCSKKQTIELGDSTCVACGLRISIRVEEPRCQTCDYLLVGLTSSRCPECGTAIGAPGTATADV